MLTLTRLRECGKRVLQVKPWRDRCWLLHLWLGYRLPLVSRELGKYFFDLCLRSLRDSLLLRMGLGRLLLTSVQCAEERHDVHWWSAWLCWLSLRP